ncbi:hypothetical protein [Acetobacter sp. DmW_125131]|uniref:hypothetical protein n=1 Tax=Acetobacter sp. DmW_125131 TaxID=2591082 RepID=UPI001237EE00|nr:hypothetical protein [Acetobacter sp. DmW_125131]KAA8389414.1 hypothetical protein FKW22_15375 [Acetobacter sp. DmW_125124]KAA8391869.1 hypothetical protein FKW19_15135 [Acetobacter sp. DmW_125128]KAA8394961.1 hypothetical protein FKW20_12265 [Acetobacter sp. DmW_125127]KAA8401626.1 hypothetical protein FKW32_15130 [Acetobacter sp. DmW_125132]KAA8403297.1 hypothetical protein FKW15_11245 [Acetobacter sp. DmW_125133]KAA8404434.1 hypothetical protein FKW24_10580 [Acetobacter sp. DmW_125134]
MRSIQIDRTVIVMQNVGGLLLRLESIELGMRVEAVGATIPVRAAQYVRMSTDHQKYSTENQAEIIAAYAGRRNFQMEGSKNP